MKPPNEQDMRATTPPPVPTLVGCPACGRKWHSWRLRRLQTMLDEIERRYNQGWRGGR
ncbi:MAG: hypothetical protein WCE51_08245 [Chthoniobacterales bacterium]